CLISPITAYSKSSPLDSPSSKRVVTVPPLLALDDPSPSQSNFSKGFTLATRSYSLAADSRTKAVSSRREINASSIPQHEMPTMPDISGRICMTVEPFKSVWEAPESFLECSALSDQEVKEYNITQKYLGVWVKRDCPDKFEFDPIRQRCLDKRKMHRQPCTAPLSDDPNPDGETGCFSPCR
ncbi:Protein T10E10.4, partial [Aphelenchoides avenae]